jgi:hypothetical protein
MDPLRVHEFWVQLAISAEGGAVLIMHSYILLRSNSYQLYALRNIDLLWGTVTLRYDTTLKKGYRSRPLN